MQDTLTALHAAIIDNPTDRTARLVYADALDESGDAVNSARAEFIRAHIALETMAENDTRREALTARCDELFAEHWINWWKPVCAAVGLPEPFVPRHRLRERVKRLVRREKREPGAPYRRVTDNPGVYSILFEEHSCTAQFIAGFPELLYFYNTPRLLDRWVHAMPLAHLRWAGNGFHDEAWHAFDGPHLAKVSELILDRLPHEGVTLIAHSEYLRDLATLKLVLPRPADVAMRELLANPTWRDLRSLTFAGVTPPDAIQIFAERCKLPTLESLSLGICEVPVIPSLGGLTGAFGTLLSEMFARFFTNFPFPRGPINWAEYGPPLMALARSPIVPQLRQFQLLDVDPFSSDRRAVEPWELDPASRFADSVVLALADGLNADKLERLELPLRRLSAASRDELAKRFGPRLVLM